MSIHNIHFQDKILLNLCFLELSEEFSRYSKNKFESAMVKSYRCSSHRGFTVCNCY